MGWITKYEDSNALVRIQVWAEDGGYKSTKSVSLGGHILDGNPNYRHRKVHPTKPAAIRCAVEKASRTIFEDHLFSRYPGLRTWAEKHQPKPTGQAELLLKQ